MLWVIEADERSTRRGGGDARWTNLVPCFASTSMSLRHGDVFGIEALIRGFKSFKNGDGGEAPRQIGASKQNCALSSLLERRNNYKCGGRGRQKSMKQSHKFNVKGGLILQIWLFAQEIKCQMFLCIWHGTLKPNAFLSASCCLTGDNLILLLCFYELLASLTDICEYSLTK